VISRLLRRWARDVTRRLVFPPVEAGWAALFRLLDIIFRPQPRTWRSSGDERVLVIAPHPDDETIGCGGTIALHARAGDQVTVAIVTDGGSSRAGGIERGRMVAIRRIEAERAIATLGREVRLVQMGLPEGEWQDAELMERLASLWTQVKPTLIYSPSRIDFHPEHVGVARALAAALGRCAPKELRAIRLYELQVPLTPLLTNLVSPISAVAVQKKEALSAYHSQRRALYNWPGRRGRYNAAFYGLDAPVEAFWEISVTGYRALMTSDERAAFRGIHTRPFTDGLAWLVGWQARRRARKACPPI
jgi:LmbE family N-acetylglucosaminyl deacetylase